MNIVSDRFLTVYQPHSENSLDEAMVKFQGRSCLKKYMPVKPINWGIKVCCRADAHNVYLCEYTGRSEGVECGLGEEGRARSLREASGEEVPPLF